MHYTYKTKGTCSRKIDFDINDGVVSNIVFTGGCDGNLKAIPRLVNGWTAAQIAGKLRGVTCGFKGTSCSDQLARAVTEAAAAEKGSGSDI